MAKNYYDILEVDRESSEEDIKRAYRRLVKQWHPDRNPFNEAAAQYFLLIQEAYEHLCDYRRRSEYNDKLDGKYHEPVRVYYQPYTPPTPMEVSREKRKKALKVVPVVTALLAGIGLMIYLFTTKQDTAYYETRTKDSVPAFTPPVRSITTNTSDESKTGTVVTDSASKSLDSMFRVSLKNTDKEEAPKKDTIKAKKPAVKKPEPILEADYD